MECVFDAVGAKLKTGKQCAWNVLLSIVDGTESGIQGIPAITRKLGNANGAAVWLFRVRTTARSTITTSANALQREEKCRKTSPSVRI